jgi:sugar/nucleoside kinase (ribokinase family)
MFIKSRMNQSTQILTVGSMAFDSIQSPAGKADKVLGGSVNYFSIAASFFSPVSILGVVGEDFPVSHLEWLQTKKIDTAGISIVPGKTFHWVGQYDQNLNEARTLSTALNVFEHFDPKLSPKHCDADIVFLANIDPVLQTSVLNQVKKPKLVACDSMNFWITGKPEELKATLKRVDILSINEGEAALLSGEKNLIKAARIIQNMGPSVIIIKRGEYGAMLITKESIFLAPAFPVVNVIDPTGAGDSFAGAFVGYLAAHGVDRTWAETKPKEWETTLRQAVVSGCTMASFTVEDFSMHRLMKLEKSEFDSRRANLISMLTVC